MPWDKDKNLCLAFSIVVRSLAAATNMTNNQEDEITVLPTTCEKPHEIIHSVGDDQSAGGYVDYHREPTDEELATLRRVSETIPLRAWYFNA